METIKLTLEDSIATLAFNSPEVMNTFTSQMSIDLESAIRTLENNPSIRAVLLKGEGACFMAGGDINTFMNPPEVLGKVIPDVIDRLHRSMLKLRQLHCPVLACVHGSVAGAGVSFMLACDLVISADNTIFSTAYCAIGTSPDGGSTYYLPRVLGTKRAMQLFMTSERFSAEQAQEWGIVNWVVPADALEEQANQMLLKLANGPTKSFAKVKQLIYQSEQQTLASQFELERQCFLNSIQTEDFQIGVNAFINKQAPKFTGK